MQHKTPTALFAAAALIGAHATAAQASPNFFRHHTPTPVTATQSLKLDLANPVNILPTGVAAQSTALTKNVDYLVTVSGTGSLWAPKDGDVLCGLPELKPVLTPTVGAITGPAETDAALLFAAPTGVWLGDNGDACDPTYKKATPPYNSGFRMGASGGMKPVVPIGGVPKVPSPTHTYTYLAVGDGTPLKFQFEDIYVPDNSGVLSITIAQAKTCRIVARHGKWRGVAKNCVVPFGQTQGIIVP